MSNPSRPSSSPSVAIHCAKCGEAFTAERPEIFVGDYACGHWTPRFSAHFECVEFTGNPAAPSSSERAPTPKPYQVRPHTPGSGYICRACEKPHLPGCIVDRDPSASCANVARGASSPATKAKYEALYRWVISDPRRLPEDVCADIEALYKEAALASSPVVPEPVEATYDERALWCSCGVFLPDVTDGIAMHKESCPRFEYASVKRAMADQRARINAAQSAINKACAIIELGDERLLRCDGPAGGQPPDLTLSEWRELYVTLDAARSSSPVTPEATSPKRDEDVRFALGDALSAALNSAWNDYTGDTGRFPNCLTVTRDRGRVYVEADFRISNFARMAADWLVSDHPAIAAIFAAARSTPTEENPK